VGCGTGRLKCLQAESGAADGAELRLQFPDTLRSEIPQLALIERGVVIGLGDSAGIDDAPLIPPIRIAGG
ncbi:MAG: hypothetical protein ACPGJU_09845, partial [Coraliomargarita sp.]